MIFYWIAQFCGLRAAGDDGGHRAHQPCWWTPRLLHRHHHHQYCPPHHHHHHRHGAVGLLDHISHSLDRNNQKIRIAELFYDFKFDKSSNMILSISRKQENWEKQVLWSEAICNQNDDQALWERSAKKWLDSSQFIAELLDWKYEPLTQHRLEQSVDSSC